MNSIEQIAPCPFCGGEAVAPTHDDEFEAWRCGCSACNAHTWADTEDEAIAAWNLRTASEKPARQSGWVYDIQWGPEGQQEYSHVYAGSRLVAVMKTFDASKVAVHRGGMTASEQPASGEAMDRIAAAICRTVAEIPDRSSPDDFPEAMLVTADELHTIVTCALETEAEFAALSTTSEAPEAGRLREALEPWPGCYADLQRRRVTTLAKLGLMLSIMASGEAAEVVGYDAADLYAEVLMALAIEDAEDTDIALEVAFEHPDGDILIRAVK